MINIIIESPCHISKKENMFLNIKKTDTNETTKLSLDQISVIVLESDRSSITVKAMNAIVKNNILLIMCDENFLPSINVIGRSRHYHPHKHLRAQLNINKKFSDELWYEVIKVKLLNQLRVLQLMKCDDNIISRIERLIDTLEIGDITNREGIIAKMFFRELYGSNFIRERDCVTNQTLNYGYTIFAALISRLICAQGLTPVLGIHHISDSNYWNLSYDLVEVIRPLVDYWVAYNHLAFKTNITKENKVELINLFNATISFKNQNRTVKGALRDYIESFTQALVNRDSKHIKAPLIIEQEW